MPTVVYDNRVVNTALGELTGGGDLSSNRVLGLANVASVNPGTYGNNTHYSKISVDKKGRVTNVVSLSFSNSYMANTTLESPMIIGRITKNGHWVTPFINVQADHDVSGVGGTNQTSGITNAFSEANLTGRELYFGPGSYDFSSVPTLTQNGQSIKGAGQNATILRHTANSGHTLTCSGQFPNLQDFTMWPLAWKDSSSYEIAFLGTYRGEVNRVLSQYHSNFFYCLSSATPSLIGCTTLYAHGPQHIMMTGVNGSISAGLHIDRHSANNPWPVVSTTFKEWALSTNYTVGQYFYENGFCWVCTQEGMTASSGTLTPDMTNSYNWTLNSVTHGGAKFRALHITSHAGVRMDSYSASLSIAKSAFINGGYGLAMQDSANTGSSYPLWLDADAVQTDHPFFAGIHADAGIDINVGTKSWIGSTLAGPGINLVGNFRGLYKQLSARVSGNAHNGLNMAAGKDNKVAYSQFSQNSVGLIGTYSDIIVADGVSDFDISHNTLGMENGVGSGYTYLGVHVVGSGSDRYNILYNKGRGLAAGMTVFDSGGGTNGTTKFVDFNAYNAT